MANKVVFEKMVLDMAQKIKNECDTKTKCGSSLYLLFGEELSSQAVSVRFGNQLESLLNEFSTACGVKHLSPDMIDGHQVDSLREIKEVLHYEEQKTNAGLDSEKIVATINKVLAVKESLNKTQNLPVVASILHSTVWEESDAPDFRSYYVRYKNAGVEVKTMDKYFSELEVQITKEDFYSIFRKAGEILRK
jgi:hypothetical protein